jgi:hypothetical protein
MASTPWRHQQASQPLDSHQSTMGEHGVYIDEKSTITIVDTTLTDNGADGAHVSDGSMLSVSDGIIEDNSARGIVFTSNSGGTVTQNQIRSSGAEGVGMFSDAGGVPTPVVHYNNIYSNAVTGSTTVEEVTVSGVSASVSTYYAANDTSSSHTEPAGRQVKRVYVNYTETTYRCSGQLRNQNNSVIQSFSSNFAGWVEVGIDDTAFNVYTSKTCGNSGSCNISITKSELLDSSMNSYGNPPAP